MEGYKRMKIDGMFQVDDNHPMVITHDGRVLVYQATDDDQRKAEQFLADLAEVRKEGSGY